MIYNNHSQQLGDMIFDLSNNDSKNTIILLKNDFNNNIIINKMEQGSLFNLIKFGFNIYSNLQNIEAHGAEEFIEHLTKGSVITMANHQSMIDDPMIWTPLHDYLTKYEDFRYVIGAQENFDSLKFLSANDLKILFVKRRNTNLDKKGTGLHQDCFFKANEILCKDKGWIHIFPEGKMIQECGSLIGRFKPGVGNLIMSCDEDLRLLLNETGGEYRYSGSLPIIIPIAHFGMHNILPMHQYPNFAQKVHIFYGEPIIITDLLTELKQQYDIPNILRMLTLYLEQQYLKFYLDCFNKVYQTKFVPNEIYLNNDGYYHHCQGAGLHDYAGKMVKIRLQLLESKNDLKLLQEYIKLLESKEEFLLKFNTRDNITALEKYNIERLECNLFSTRKSLLEARKRYSNLLYPSCTC